MTFKFIENNRLSFPVKNTRFSLADNFFEGLWFFRTDYVMEVADSLMESHPEYFDHPLYKEVLERECRRRAPCASRSASITHAGPWTFGGIGSDDNRGGTGGAPKPVGGNFHSGR